MNPDHAAIDRRRELLLDRALQGLDPAEAAELATFPAAAADLTHELAAAAVLLAVVGTTGHPALPVDLAARVERWSPRPRLVVPVGPSPRRRVAPWLGWVAAAAALVVIVVDRTGTPLPAPVEATNGAVPRSPQPEPWPLSVPSSRLVATAHPLARGAGGAVIWDQARQQGTLRIDGLAPVDPRAGCYQLWIFDATRDSRYPVDGGTFTIDAPASGRVVAVRPGVPIRQPALFAVTLEPPGGVVVSDRERLLLTAAWTSPAPSDPPPPRR